MIELPEDRLKRHYHEKYSSAVKGRLVASYRRFPSNRWEAAVRWSGSGDRAIEIGAGGGVVFRTIRHQYKFMTALDISAPRVKALKDEFASDPNVEVLLLDIERESIPHPDGTFDLAILIDVIEHFVDPIGPLVEIYRVMKPGGCLIVGAPNIAKWTRRIKLCFGYFPATASINEGLLMYDGRTPVDLFDEGHLHYFTTDRYRAFCGVSDSPLSKREDGVLSAHCASGGLLYFRMYSCVQLSDKNFDCA